VCACVRVRACGGGAGELIRDSRGCNYQDEKFCLLLALVAAQQKLGRGRTKAVSRRRLTAEVRVQFLASPCGFCGGQSCSVRVFSFSRVRWWSFVSVVIPVLEPHSIICCRRCIFLSIDSFCK
jgi:hypothetical protein